MSKLRHTKALELCSYLFKSLSDLPEAVDDFVKSATKRVLEIQYELTKTMVVSERQITTLREIAKGVEMRAMQQVGDWNRERKPGEAAAAWRN